MNEIELINQKSIKRNIIYYVVITTIIYSKKKSSQ